MWLIADIDDCVGITCLNGGFCQDLVNSYQCNCDLGYTGPNCETGKIITEYPDFEQWWIKIGKHCNLLKQNNCVQNFLWDNTLWSFFNHPVAPLVYIMAVMLVQET